MWTEALQICADYLPNMLPKLQREYEEQVSAKVPRDVNSLLLQAKQWEQNGEFKAAIDCYIRIASATREKPIVDRVLNEAATLTITYLCDDEATQTARTLGKLNEVLLQLLHMGFTFQAPSLFTYLSSFISRMAIHIRVSRSAIIPPPPESCNFSIFGSL